jgi:hypothetical protein
MCGSAVALLFGGRFDRYRAAVVGCVLFTRPEGTLSQIKGEIRSAHPTVRETLPLRSSHEAVAKPMIEPDVLRIQGEMLSNSLNL